MAKRNVAGERVRAEEADAVELVQENLRIDRDDCGSMLYSVKEWTRKQTEASELAGQVGICTASLIGMVLSQLSSVSAEVGRMALGIEQLGERRENVEGRLESVERELKKSSQRVKEIWPAIRAFDKNLRQVRVLMDRVAGRVDKLSTEFIEREVKEPLLKDQVSLYNDLRQEEGNGGNGIAFFVERARSLLEAREAVLIEPEEGSLFDPREHQAIEKVPTSRKRLDRRVAKVRRSGLRLNGRVVQQAWVAVHLFEKKVSQATRKQGEQR